MNFRPDFPAIDLGGAWKFAFSDQPPKECASLAEVEASGLKLHPCTVPGALETDLYALGLFPDPFSGLNILEAQKYERHHVWYGRKFCVEEIPADKVAELVFEGIDCCAEIYLNGQHIGSVDNMLIAHPFKVDGLLRAENELLIHIRPAVEEAKKYPYPAGLAAQHLSYEALYIRKAPHMYGWDIMPRAVSSGLWRSVKLRFLPRQRFDSLYLETLWVSDDHAEARLSLHYHALLVGADRCEIEMTGVCGDSRFELRKALHFEAGHAAFTMLNPRLWWPRGSGEPALYDVTVRLLKNGIEIDRASFRHGIRKIELERTSITNEKGEGEFCFRVNGQKIFIKGSNWVPADAFHWRDAERIPKILPLVLEVGCNMLRCWGGNVYEDDAFFDWCDANGIMVWQDFAMSCAMYPQDTEFAARLELEARQVVRRLRQHASLALWAGDNECDQAPSWHHAGDPNRNILTRRVLPEILKEEDPSRPWLPSSPYIDATTYAAGEKYITEQHLWGPRDYYKGDYYTQALCHFASETGYHGCPPVESLRKFISADKLWPPQDNDEWILHSTNPTLDTASFSPRDARVNLMLNQVRVLFGQVPDTLEDFSFASQASQGEAMKFFVERFRGGKWRRTGLIWWNLMDGWPQLSDAVVDYYFGKKLAFDFIRRSQQDVCLLLREPVDGRQEIVAVNDLRCEVALSFNVMEDGHEIVAGKATIPANGIATVGTIASEGLQKFYRLEWKFNGTTGTNHYLAGKPPYDLETYRQWLRTGDFIR